MSTSRGRESATIWARTLVRGSPIPSWRLDMRSLLSAAVLISLSAFGSVAAGDWPTFRGPNGSGVSEDDKVPTEWNDKKNLKWKLTLPGAGDSSPIVVGNKVFVTC